jgi:hemerythrin-like domain-containing protein
MKPTEILMAEHRVIEQVLNVLESMAAQAERTGKVEKQDATDIVSFFRTFADKSHHGKEEAILFPALEAKGFPRDGGPTGVMMHEHELGRSYVRGMADAIEKDAANPFAQNARAFIELLRQHIQKEDHCLFGMADQALTPADQANLLTAFETVERDHMGAGTHEKFLKIADALAVRYGVARATVGASSHACCCHH